MKPVRILWILAIAGFVVGLVGVFQRVAGGHTVAAYNTYVPWGLWVAAYAMMIGLSVGAYLVAALAFGFGVRVLRPLGAVALFAALATLFGGLLAIWLDLGHPARFWRLFLATNPTSIMGLMVWFYTLYGLLLIALILLTQRDPDSRVVRTLSLLGLLLVIVFGGAEGALFGVVSAQALWESGLTPILFLVEGALSGVALVLFLGVVLDRISPDAARWLRGLVLGLLAAAIVLQWAEISTALYAGIPAKAESLNLVLFGPFWWVFWFFHVGLGILVPLLLLLFAPRRPWALAAAGGLIALTAIAGKLNLVIPALVVPEFEGLRTAFTGMGLTFDYFPTFAEWLLLVWIVSFSALIFLAGYRVIGKTTVRGEQAATV
jgi:molybdopterin-containing oxidoreductase family membrane subunit